MSDMNPRSGSRIIHGDNLAVLATLPDGLCQVVYLDPPFNTGRTQTKTRRTMNHSDEGTQAGFGGRRYEVTVESLHSYDDQFTDYWGFLGPRLDECRRILHDTGTLYVHLDWREAHYAKVWLDGLFGRECFLNEIIWAYDYGAKSKRRWPTKHDTILVYVKNPDTYFFDSESVDREPYMAPGLVTEEKRERGKLPTDVWWHTIVSPTGKEKNGYPTQKPLGVLKRIITASTRPGDLVVDPFAGSGTTGEAAGELGREFLMVDSHPEAIAVMTKRLARFSPTVLEHLG